MQIKKIILRLALIAFGSAAPVANFVSSHAKVTNDLAFTTGAGNTGTFNTGGQGHDDYKCYYGGWQNFPAKSEWVSFDKMFEKSKGYAMRHSCSNIGGSGPDNNDEQIEMVRRAILKVAEDSMVDPRFIFAVVMQESGGCVNIKGTVNPDPNGPFNPGLMQSHSGSSFVGNAATPAQQEDSVVQMIVDGTQGTIHGDGLVQLINKYGNIYEAAREYNSGPNGVDKSNLNNGGVATAAYVSDIANKMTGWVWSDKRFESC